MSEVLKVLPFQRQHQAELPAGIALEIRVTQPGKIGKFTRFTIRKGRLPLRADEPETSLPREVALREAPRVAMEGVGVPAFVDEG